MQCTWARNGHCYYHREQLHSRACLNREVQVHETKRNTAGVGLCYGKYSQRNMLTKEVYNQSLN